MKVIICFLALIAVSTGQDNSCQINIPASFCMEAYSFGSFYSSDPAKPLYQSFVGELMYLVNDTGHTETSALVVNETLVVNDGTTGQQLAAGWSWVLTEGTTAYTKSKFGGLEQPCRIIKGVPFQPLPDIFRRLNQLNPVPGVPPDPHTPYICQGGVAGTPGVLPDMLIGIGYNHHGDAMDQLVYFSELTNATQIMSKVNSLLPLSEKYKPIFDHNPCKHAEVSVGDIPEDHHGYVRRVMHRFH